MYTSKSCKDKKGGIKSGDMGNIAYILKEYFIFRDYIFKGIFGSYFTYIFFKLFVDRNKYFTILSSF